MKYCLIFSFLIFTSFYDHAFGNNWEACGGGWEQYKDEKCFKILDDQPTQSFESAIEKCASLDNVSTLVIIQSLEEQKFLSNYLFKIHKKVDNFWIGAKYSNTSNSFEWLDNSELIFTNWDSNYPSKRNANSCVEMQADDDVAGKWKNKPCEKRYAVVCQKMQFWSIERLQKAFLYERIKHTEALDKANKKIIVLEHNQENSINPVPIGFIYVQLPHQPEPKTLWPAVQWKNVTSEYAGMFFRAGGGDAAEFGTIQSENAPRVIRVEGINSDYVFNKNIQIKVGETSEAISTGSNGDGKLAIKVQMSGGEVRPRNMAILVWKRVA